MSQRKKVKAFYKMICRICLYPSKFGISNCGIIKKV